MLLPHNTHPSTTAPQQSTGGNGPGGAGHHPRVLQGGSQSQHPALRPWAQPSAVCAQAPVLCKESTGDMKGRTPPSAASGPAPPSTPDLAPRMCRGLTSCSMQTTHSDFSSHRSGGAVGATVLGASSSGALGSGAAGTSASTVFSSSASTSRSEHQKHFHLPPTAHSWGQLQADGSSGL